MRQRIVLEALLLAVAACACGRAPSPEATVPAPSTGGEHATPEESGAPGDAAEPDGLAAARAFVARLQALSNANDPAVADAYADDALIVAERIGIHGPGQPLVSTGRELKQALPEALARAAQADDRLVLRELAFAREGETIEVRAVRYSTLRCYEDRYFLLRLRPGGAMGYEIIRQEMRTQSFSSCQDVDAAALAREVAGELEGSLPRMLDERTRLDEVRRDASDLTYLLTLVSVSSSRLPRLDPTLRVRVLREVCLRPDLRRLGDHGGTVTYLYRSRDQRETLRFTMTQRECP